ncbi:hypothetical protein ABZ499_31750 [Streptomyces sp. NPDC019990]|uniref:hypothetical protein n=1 Tax=Streptomyces sp. NPDC019990 TaxID=3154693 RepID=UPI0034036234
MLLGQLVALADLALLHLAVLKFAVLAHPHPAHVLQVVLVEGEPADDTLLQPDIAAHVRTVFSVLHRWPPPS